VTTFLVNRSLLSRRCICVVQLTGLVSLTYDDTSASRVPVVRACGGSCHADCAVSCLAVCDGRCASTAGHDAGIDGHVGASNSRCDTAVNVAVTLCCGTAKRYVTRCGILLTRVLHNALWASSHSHVPVSLCLIHTRFA
jgi:hypothetical protein